jgi:photosystem II stability/assembly factor-like uncharacterized protein
MGTDKIMLHRRTVLSSILGAGFTAAVAMPGRADVPQYPQLINPAIPVRNPAGIYFVAGTLAGSRVVAGGEEGVIVYSDDAGQSWHQASVPVSATITDIAFASPQVGWATGAFGVILKTSDGGKSWVKQLDGIAEIALMNTATQAFAASQPPQTAAAVAAGTPSAADRATHRAQILTGGGPDKPFLSLLPISETEVFAFGTYRFAEHSTDGGATWTDWSMNIGDPESQNIYGAAAIGGAYYLTSETGLIFKSTDGGKTFPQLTQVNQSNPATLFGIMDTGNGGVLAYGVAGEMYLSTDQGKTWNASQFTGSSNVNAVISLMNGNLLIAGDAGGGLWMSRDHGASFSLITRNPVMSINALVPLSGLKFLILSDIGVFPADLSQMHA